MTSLLLGKSEKLLAIENDELDDLVRRAPLAVIQALMKELHKKGLRLDLHKENSEKRT